MKNTGSEPIFALVSDRNLECSDGKQISWALSHGVVQGEDVGPFRVQPGGWAVFVSSINVPKGVDLEKCKANMDISMETEEVLQFMKTASFPLKPTGFYGGIH